MIASREGKVELVKLLLSYDTTDVNRVDKVGRIYSVMLYIFVMCILCMAYVHVHSSDIGMYYVLLHINTEA